MLALIPLDIVHSTCEGIKNHMEHCHVLYLAQCSGFVLRHHLGRGRVEVESDHTKVIEVMNETMKMYNRLIQLFLNVFGWPLA
jgi:hypothetical protein